MQARRSPKSYFNHLRPKVFWLIASLIFVYFFNNFFIIKKIKCYLDNQNCPPEIEQKIRSYLNTNVLTFNQKQLTQSLKAAFPISDVQSGFKLFNTFEITLKSDSQAINLRAFLIKDLPTDVIGWIPPIASSSSFNIFENGFMLPSTDQETQINYYLTQKPNLDSVKSLYLLIKLARKYLNIREIQVVDSLVTLRRDAQPDIILSIPFDEEFVGEELQSITYLATVKKDAKVVDLRFKNPIIR